MGDKLRSSPLSPPVPCTETKGLFRSQTQFTVSVSQCQPTHSSGVRASLPFQQYEPAHAPLTCCLSKCTQRSRARTASLLPQNPPCLSPLPPVLFPRFLQRTAGKSLVTRARLVSINEIHECKPAMEAAYKRRGSRAARSRAAQVIGLSIWKQGEQSQHRQTSRKVSSLRLFPLSFQLLAHPCERGREC